MWKSLSLLAILAILFTVVSSGTVNYNKTITITSNVIDEGATGENGTSATPTANSTTVVIRTHAHRTKNGSVVTANSTTDVEVQTNQHPIKNGTSTPTANSTTVVISTHAHRTKNGTSVTANSTTDVEVKTNRHRIKKCAAHEKYVKCPEKLCQPQVCSDVGFPQCSSHDEKYYQGKKENLQNGSSTEEPCSGPPACVCIKNYVRNDEGICMPAKHCPSCGNDKNATFGCGINCGRRCSNYKKKPMECPDECHVNRCECKKEYVFDDYTGKCVLPEDCSNKDLPEPKGTEETPGNGEDENITAKPCDNCNKTNCVSEDNVQNSGEMKCGTEDGDEEEETEGKEDIKVSTSDNLGETTTPTTTTNTSKQTDETGDESDTTTEDSEDTTTSSENSEITNTKSGEGSHTTTEALEGTTLKSGVRSKTTTDNSKETTTRWPDVSNASIRNTISSTTESEKTKKPKTSTSKCGCDGADSTKEISEMTSVCGGIGMTSSATEPKETNKTRTTTIEAETSSITTEKSELELTSVTSEQTTTKGPQNCKRRHERYYSCAPSCPQRSCTDYLNGIRCRQISGGPRKCKPECRCQPGYYKDSKGKCVATSECRRLVRSTTTTMTPTTDSPTTIKSTTPEAICADVALELYTKANLAFTARLLNTLSKMDPENNVMCSGSSVMYMLAQLAIKSTGDTQKELLNVLDLDTEQIRCFFPKLYANLTAEYSDIEFNWFSKIYVDDKYVLPKGLQSDLQNVFTIGPENIDFGNPSSAELISDTMAQNTGVISYIKPEMLASLSCIVLMDSQNFQGRWKKQFDPIDTSTLDFFTRGRTEKRPTMYQKGIFLYTESTQLGAQVIQIPYATDHFTLTLFLPYSAQGIRDLLRNLSNAKLVSSVFDNLRLQNVELFLPIFNITVAKKLKVPTEKTNVKKIFNNETSELARDSSGKIPYVSEILQKLRLQVDEFGMGNTKTVDFPELQEETSTSRRKYRRTYLYKANRPFVFYLCYDNILLFAGAVLR